MLRHVIAPLFLIGIAGTADPAVSPLDWIGGHWCTGPGDEIFEELWMPSHGGVALGMSRSRSGDRTTGFEYLRIVDLDGIPSYIAQPGGRPPVVFKRTAGGDAWIRFENPDHDFPQRIEYRREGDTLQAEIAGPGEEGAQVVIAFDYHRCEAPAEPVAPPQWFLDDIEAHTAGGGRWVADNSAYQGENEPFDAYVLEWKAGFDGMTMTGRLFGLADGKETPAFWEFRQYWHPGRNEAVVEQFGWGGAMGIGTLTQDGVSDQTIYNADGSTARIGHRAELVDADTRVQASFDIDDGEWRPRRTYTWIRQRPEPAGSAGAGL